MEPAVASGSVRTGHKQTSKELPTNLRACVQCGLGLVRHEIVVKFDKLSSSAFTTLRWARKGKNFALGRKVVTESHLAAAGCGN